MKCADTKDREVQLPLQTQAFFIRLCKTLPTVSLTLSSFCKLRVPAKKAPSAAKSAQHPAGERGRQPFGFLPDLFESPRFP